uniref:GG12472 n=1 Tax=Drosophila erecta TaxID=7220 RepID=B3P224_DROER
MAQEVPWVQVDLAVLGVLAVLGDLVDRADPACLGVPEDLEDPVVQTDLEALEVQGDLEVLVVPEDPAARDVKRRERQIEGENVAQKQGLGLENIHKNPLKLTYQLVHRK